MKKHNQTSPKYSAFDTAAYYLSFKDRTVKELTDKLREKEYADEEIDNAVSRLMGYGYLDDERYAEAYIKNNRKRKGLKLIERELYAKGVSRDVLSNVLESMDVYLDSEAEIVQDIYNRRFMGSDMNDEVQKRRIFSYFQRRGFSYEVISKAVRNVGEE
jgi:regulatory protein